MPPVKLRIPKVDRIYYGEGTLSVLVKTKLVEALAVIESQPAPKVPPLFLSADVVTIWVSDDQQVTIEALARSHQINGVGPAASGLLHAMVMREHGERVYALQQPTSTSETTLDRINRAFGDVTRVDQGLFYVGLRSEIAIHRPPHDVIFAEASTGVGKTRAVLSVVLDWVVEHPDEHAVIAMPSYNVLLQTVQQWNRIGSVFALPLHEVLVGMQEFVSVAALERVLADHPNIPGAAAARSWLDKGGYPPPDDPLGHKWLMRSLVDVAGNAWTLDHEIQLDADTAEEDPGMLAYRQQFATGRKVPVVFCTHAMLAVEVRQQTVLAARRFAEQENVSVTDAAFDAWKLFAEEDRRTSMTWEVRNNFLRSLITENGGRLPPIGLLVVDEAHLLEQQFASVFASGTSLARLESDLRRLHQELPRLVLVRDIQAVEECCQALKTFGASQGAERVSAIGHAVLQNAVEALRTTLTSLNERLSRSEDVASRKEVRKLRAVKLALDVATRASQERSGMRVQVSWSPSFHWPSVTVGRYDVSRELDFLWAVLVRDRSIVVSATLYEDVSLQGLEGMRRILSVRSSSVRPLPPVRPLWLYESVTLYLAGKTVHADGLPRFRRPVKNDGLDPLDLVARQERWRADVSEYICKVYESAAGGVLILMTAHAERVELIRRLADRLPQDCLLDHREGSTLESLRWVFLEKVAQGHKPCLVAVGAAWTGLDISGDGLATITGQSVSAAEDNVLTDLVIPVMPLGANRSLTHEWRRERLGMVAEVAASVIMMRQGVGRLVRREGLPCNRRLHVLDARIHETRWGPLLRPVMATLSRYTRRLEV